MKGILLTAGIACLLCFHPLAAGVVELEPIADVTLNEAFQGLPIDGNGPLFYLGTAEDGESPGQRALIKFDLDGALPEDAIVQSVTLTFFVTPSSEPLLAMSILRVEENWDETHIATGVSSTEASARALVPREGWVSTTSSQLSRDVRSWLRNPSENFGWLLVSDRTQATNTKAIASREFPDSYMRPRITIRFRMPGSTDVRDPVQLTIDPWRADAGGRLDYGVDDGSVLASAF
jgi:hypothetical protein